MKLYTASAKVNYKDYKNVPFHFFVTQRSAPPIPYEEAIDFEAINKDREVGTNNQYVMGFIDECFTESEVEELRKYLVDRQQFNDIGNDADILEIREVDLPIKENIAGWGALGAGGLNGDDYYMMDQEYYYNLSVPIWAHFSLEGCKCKSLNFQEEVPEEIQSLE